MRVTTLSRLLALMVLCGATAIASHAQQDTTQTPATDPLAEAAKKARAQQKAEGKPKKVYTDDDFASTAKSDAPASSTSDKPKAGDEAAAADKDKKEDAKGEQYWRDRFAKAHEKLATAEKELDVLQRELDKSELQYYPDPQKAMVQQHDRSDINDKKAKLDAKQKEIDDLKQQISDMEDELRKSGGDPGWAR